MKLRERVMVSKINRSKKQNGLDRLPNQIGGNGRQRASRGKEAPNCGGNVELAGRASRTILRQIGDEACGL
jgi:hypothetical protein